MICYGFLDSKIKILPNGREVLEMGDSVNFAVITSDDYLILGKQFRASNKKISINLFGGYIEKGESWRETLEREMYEETNITSDCVHSIHPLFENQYVSMGYTTERNTTAVVQLNKKLEELVLKCNDNDENISMHIFPVDKFSVKNYLDESEDLKLTLVLTRILSLLSSYESA